MPGKKYKQPSVADFKPDCYKCAWRRPLPGDAHSKCEHPGITHDAITDEPMHQLMAIFASVGRVDPIVNASGAEHLNVRGNTHGIKNGWFNWPWNFDPIWLETCRGWVYFKDACVSCEKSLVCISGSELMTNRPDNCSPETWKWRRWRDQQNKKSKTA